MVAWEVLVVVVIVFSVIMQFLSRARIIATTTLTSVVLDNHSVSKTSLLD